MPKERRKKFNKKSDQEKDKKYSIIKGKLKTKEKNKPKRLKKHQFKYNGKEDAFECPKTKMLLEIESIVTINGQEEKNTETNIV